MPNWVTNKLYIYGEHVEDFKQAIKGYPAVYEPNETESVIQAEPAISEFTFHSLVPVPDEILKQGYSNTGYQWQTDNWGTKWDVGFFALQEPSDQELIYEFDTAWSPPIRWVEQASVLFPQFIFSLSFYEDSNAFAGKLKFQNGKLLFEHGCVDNALLQKFKEKEFGITEE